MTPTESWNNVLVIIDKGMNAESGRIQDKGSIKAPETLIALAFDYIVLFI